MLKTVFKFFLKLHFRSRVFDFNTKQKIKVLKIMQKWNHARVITILRPRQWHFYYGSGPDGQGSVDRVRDFLHFSVLPTSRRPVGTNTFQEICWYKDHKCPTNRLTYGIKTLNKII